MNKENIESPNQNYGANSEFAVKKQKEGVFYHIMGANIIKARNKKGFTQEQLADKLGISRVSVGNIESGKQRLPVHLLYAVAYALEVDINYIFTDIKRNGKGLYFESTVATNDTSPVESPNVQEGKTLDNLISEYACREYQHIANEPQFDCEMVEFQKPDLYLFLHAYNKWQSQHSYTEAYKTKFENENFIKYVADSKQHIENLKQAINQDKTGLAKGLESVCKLAKSYDWIKDGRGPYAFDDERYREEVLNMINEIQELSLKALQESGVLANNAFGGIFESTEKSKSYSEAEVLAMFEQVKQKNTSTISDVMRFYEKANSEMTENQLIGVQIALKSITDIDFKYLLK